MGIVVLVAAAFIAAVLVIGAIVRAVEAHAMVVIIGLGVGLPLIIAAVIAFLRGLNHHTVLQLTPLPPPPPRPQLPPPASPQPIQVSKKTRPDPWTADGPTWAEIVEQAERDELLQQGPREARIVRFGGCEGPRCHEALDDRPWVIEVEGDDGQVENHSFCSGECAQDWQDKDSAERAGRSGIR